MVERDGGYCCGIVDGWQIGGFEREVVAVGS